MVRSPNPDQFNHHDVGEGQVCDAQGPGGPARHPRHLWLLLGRVRAEAHQEYRGCSSTRRSSAASLSCGQEGHQRGAPRLSYTVIAGDALADDDLRRYPLPAELSVAVVSFSVVIHRNGARATCRNTAKQTWRSRLTWGGIPTRTTITASVGGRTIGLTPKAVTASNGSGT